MQLIMYKNFNKRSDYKDFLNGIANICGQEYVNVICPLTEVGKEFFLYDENFPFTMDTIKDISNEILKYLKEKTAQYIFGVIDDGDCIYFIRTRKKEETKELELIYPKAEMDFYNAKQVFIETLSINNTISVKRELSKIISKKLNANGKLLEEVLEQIHACQELCVPVTEKIIIDWLSSNNLAQLAIKVKTHKFSKVA